MDSDHRVNADDPVSGGIEQGLTELAWDDPAVVEDPATALSRLGVDAPEGLRFDMRIQRPDTLYLVIPPAFTDEDVHRHEDVVNQMDLWRSGEQFIWILPQDAKVALLRLREQYRDHGVEADP